MIPRYSMPAMAAVWTDEAKLARWLEIEILAVEAWAKLGVVPAEDAAEVRRRAPAVDAAFVVAVAEREAVTDHDMAAFVDVVQERIGGEAAKWVHYGLTSSDVGDTALCWQLSDAAGLLIGASGELIETLRARAEQHRQTPTVGRTHGIHAEPTTFGRKLALWALQADRDRHRLLAARRAVAVGKMSGAVGTYSNVDPRVEESVCRALGLTPVPATQVIARDRHAEFLWAAASVGATVELVATEIRHLQRTEVREVEEAFGAGQKGSSAMPHKRNPIKSEQLSGLARVLRGYLGTGLENVALWHERDISHSSVERVILPDASLLAYYLLARLGRVIEGLRIFPAAMQANLDRSFGLVFSQPVLLALVESGLTRDAAYRIVQRDAQAAWNEQRPFRAVLEADPEVALPPEALDGAFDFRRSVRHADRVFEALDAVARPDEIDT
ncbi:MAG: adenylosuccinate lyase [Acidimicrobiales bacterium]